MDYKDRKDDDYNFGMEGEDEYTGFILLGWLATTALVACMVVGIIAFVIYA